MKFHKCYIRSPAPGFKPLAASNEILISHSHKVLTFQSHPEMTSRIAQELIDADDGTYCVDTDNVFDGDDTTMSNLYSPSQSIPDPQYQSQPAGSAFNRSQPRHDLTSIGSDWLDHYAEIYFRHAQPQWSFLDEDDWNTKYQAWMTSPSAVDDTHVFILLLALAVGALLSSSYHQNCPYLTHASRLYETAVRDYLGSITQHQSALTRTQASILMVIYS